MKGTFRYTPIGRFLTNQSSSGILLILSALVAILMANSSMSTEYLNFWEGPVILQIGDLQFFTAHGRTMSLLTFINDALMTLFFFTVGLEIKREVLVGELSSLKHAMFPIVAAVGGMVVPILVFLLMNRDPEALRGMPISMATDIAFSLGVLSLFGKRVPLSLKIFLTTLAVADDIGGIIVIATFYSGHIALDYLLYAMLVYGVLVIGGYYLRINSTVFYTVFGFIFWMLFIETGIHPTIAGVLIAFSIPAHPRSGVHNYIEQLKLVLTRFPYRERCEQEKDIVLTNSQIASLKQVESLSDRVISPLQKIEDDMVPLVNYAIMPLFALANATVVFADIHPSAILSGVTLTIIMSLIVGKFVGIFSFAYLAVKLKIVTLPSTINWKMVAGVALLGGIGFTVSLFIANLSYQNLESSILNEAKLGIVIGSLLAGVLGYLVLNRVLPPSDSAVRK